MILAKSQFCFSWHEAICLKVKCSILTLFQIDTEDWLYYIIYNFKQRRHISEIHQIQVHFKMHAYMYKETFKILINVTLYIWNAILHIEFEIQLIVITYMKKEPYQNITQVLYQIIHIAQHALWLSGTTKQVHHTNLEHGQTYTKLIPICTAEIIIWCSDCLCAFVYSKWSIGHTFVWCFKQALKIYKHSEVLLKQYVFPIGPNKFNCRFRIFFYKGNDYENLSQIWPNLNMMCNQTFESLPPNLILLSESIDKKRQILKKGQ